MISQGGVIRLRTGRNETRMNGDTRMYALAYLYTQEEWAYTSKVLNRHSILFQIIIFKMTNWPK